MNTKNKYILMASVPGIIVLAQAFMSSLLNTEPLDGSLNKILFGITLVSYAVIYWKYRKQKK